MTDHGGVKGAWNQGGADGLTGRGKSHHRAEVERAKEMSGTSGKTKLLIKTIICFIVKANMEPQTF